MKSRSPFFTALALLVSLAVAIPADVMAQGAQRAGQVSRAIPDVGIARGSQQIPAPIKTLVDWGDVVKTGDGGRARVSLDDGSVLNVGSSSSLTVTQHSSAAQQTQIELTYGRVRSQVVKQSKPNAKFEIHTAVGVAGVVGTDFFLGYLNGIFQIIVYEGHVKFCNLDGLCVDVVGGQTATIRDGHQASDPSRPATPSELTEAAIATSVGTTVGGPPPHHLPLWEVIGLTVLVVVPAIAIPLATRGSAPPAQKQTVTANGNTSAP
jgi:ferric-dicitrate binding protein FerR (iron transport regulator)